MGRNPGELDKKKAGEFVKNITLTPEEEKHSTMVDSFLAGFQPAGKRTDYMKAKARERMAEEAAKEREERELMKKKSMERP